MTELNREVIDRELSYHNKLYSGFAQIHFAKPAVRELRRHMVDRILKLTGIGSNARVLSLGCGIGDTELLWAPHVRELIGVDLSPVAIQQAREDAERLGVSNAQFIEGIAPACVEGRFDLVIAIFLLHHLPDRELENLPAQVRSVLNPGGMFYSLDPSRRRLSGIIGRVIVPHLMKKYQTEDERELVPEDTAQFFRKAGLTTRSDIYDFGSSPLAGLFPSWKSGYLAARRLDDVLLKAPILSRVGSNFEIIAKN